MEGLYKSKLRSGRLLVKFAQIKILINNYLSQPFRIYLWISAILKKSSKITLEK